MVVSTQVLAHTASGRVARSRCLVRLTDVQPAPVEELCQPDDEGGAGVAAGAPATPFA
jgi:hypothetical protein